MKNNEPATPAKNAEKSSNFAELYALTSDTKPNYLKWHPHFGQMMYSSRGRWIPGTTQYDE
jgi:hypothetical protein